MSWQQPQTLGVKVDFGKISGTTSNGCLQVTFEQQVATGGVSGLIGIAAVDTSLLNIMGHLSGWYNVIDTR